MPTQPPTSGVLPDSVRSELRDLQTETFEIEDVDAIDAMVMDWSSSSCSCSSCCSCSTSSCCSSSTSTGCGGG